MCWIGYCPPGKTPDVETLQDAVSQNPHGSGWAIKTDHGMELVRTMNNDYAVSSFLRCRADNPNAHAVFHARFATHGTTGESNVHPFVIPGQPWVMAHNGMLPLSDGPWSDGRSDSRILAEDIISRQSWADLRATRGKLEKWLEGDKVVILSERKQKGGPVLIFNENRGSWEDDGCWHSSMLYAKRYTSFKPHGVIVSDVTRSALSKHADQDWWERQAWRDDETAVASAMLADERAEYLELLESYDRGTLSLSGFDRMDELEEIAFAPLERLTSLEDSLS